MSDVTVACTLSPEALVARRQRVLADLLARADAHEELADGHRWSFAATDGVLAMILRMVEAERQCCRFLRFQIVIEPDGGPVSVELTGPLGTRQLLTALFES